MPAAADPAGPAGAGDGGAACGHGAGHCGGASGGCGGDSGAFRGRAADFCAAQPGEPRLGRAGDDSEHRDECGAASRVGGSGMGRRRRMRCICGLCNPMPPMWPGWTPTCSTVPRHRPRRCAMRCGSMRWRWTSRSPKIRPASWPKCCGPWRGPGREPRRGCCARPRARQRPRLWALWCRRWRRASARGCPGRA